MSLIELSIVIPVFNEEQVIRELVTRVVGTAEQTGLSYEVLVVNDASTDGTQSMLEKLQAFDALRPLECPTNVGQFQATCQGLSAAEGDCVIVLDGDLQDPPEIIADLVAAWRSVEVDDKTVVFAVKQSRSEALWFSVGRALYGVGHQLLGSGLPAGVGSYCLMTRGMARRIPPLGLDNANLSMVLGALGAEAEIVIYEKASRYDGRSRVGPMGLAREALSSLWLVSPLGRFWLKRKG